MADDLEGLDFNINIGTDSDKLNKSAAKGVNDSRASTVSGRTSAQSYSQPSESGSAESQPKGDFGIFATANHPIACLFHILFKGAAIFSFLFLNLFIGNEILAFVFIIVFSAMDFWTVKNVTGRILVNLRWWSEIDESGHEKWVFESHDDAESRQGVGATDSFVFWTGLYVTPLVWGFFAFMDFIGFKFFWMYVCILCLILTGTNTMAYYQCQKDHQSKLKDYVRSTTMNYFMSNMGSAGGSMLGGVKDMLVSKIPFMGGGGASR